MLTGGVKNDILCGSCVQNPRANEGPDTFRRCPAGHRTLLDADRVSGPPPDTGHPPLKGGVPVVSASGVAKSILILSAETVYTLGPPTISLQVVGKTPNPLNSGRGRSRNHWGHTRAKRAQRAWVQGAWLAAQRPGLRLPCAILLTRAGRGRLDSDNLGAALKAIRDEAALCLLGSAQDELPGLTWLYAQRKCSVAGVVIEAWEL